MKIQKDKHIPKLICALGAIYITTHLFYFCLITSLLYSQRHKVLSKLAHQDGFDMPETI